MHVICFDEFGYFRELLEVERFSITQKPGRWSDSIDEHVGRPLLHVPEVPAQVIIPEPVLTEAIKNMCIPTLPYTSRSQIGPHRPAPNSDLGVVSCNGANEITIRRANCRSNL